MSLVSLLKGRGPSGFGYGSSAEEVTAGLDLKGKSILITGVNSGLGAESARVLHARGARIFGAARTREKAAEACRALGADAMPIACELSEPSSVRTAVSELLRLGMPIDVLMCNAGIMALPTRELRHGQELQFLTNHIGHFILVTGLLELVPKHGRIVMLSSEGHKAAPTAGIQFDDLTFEKGYSPWAAYGQSKLANLLFARALSRRLAGSERTANAVHPGVIQTNLGRHMNAIARAVLAAAGSIAFKNVAQGASTQCYVATHPAVSQVTGEYFSSCNVARSSRLGRDDSLAERLWTVSEQIVATL